MHPAGCCSASSAQIKRKAKLAGVWLGLGHLSAEKALCLGISFQERVVNPDVTFHKEQNTAKASSSPLHVRTKGQEETLLCMTKTQLHLGCCCTPSTRLGTFSFASQVVSGQR